MGTHELNNTELEQVWRMMLKDTFDQFITSQGMFRTFALLVMI